MSDDLRLPWSIRVDIPSPGSVSITDRNGGVVCLMKGDRKMEKAMAIQGAITIEARRAETGTGSVHESATPQDIAQNTANSLFSHPKREG